MDRIDWDSQPLGLEFDRVLAERLGRHVSTVHEARVRRGIPSLRSTRGRRRSTKETEG